jgi:hypothetical protein
LTAQVRKAGEIAEAGSDGQCRLPALGARDLPHGDRLARRVPRASDGAREADRLGVRTGIRHAVAVRLRLTAYGRRVLGRTLGGVGARVQASTRGASWTVKRRALNGTERFVTPAGSFAPDQAELTPRGKRFLARMAGRLRAVKSARCDGCSAGDTIARDASDAGRAKNRRVVVTVRHGAPSRCTASPDPCPAGTRTLADRGS